MHLKPYQVCQAGEHLVTAALHRHGAYAVMFTGNMPQIDILASNSDESQVVTIQVKTKTRGSWHSTIDFGEPRTEKSADNHYWVLVAIGQTPDFVPQYFIVPQWWLKNMIYTTHEQWKKEHPEGRPINPKSRHAGITTAQVEQWRDRWDVLGICPAEVTQSV